MPIPPADIHAIGDAIRDAVADVVGAYDAEAPAADDQVTPTLLADALAQLVEVLRRVDSDRHRGGAQQGAAPDTVQEADISQLGDYGLSLLGDMATWARQLGVGERARDLELLAYPLALWATRCGAELRSLEPVVNAVASLANATRDPRALEDIYRCSGELLDAAALTVRQDLEKGNPGRPWRVLNLNRAIIATRTHNPAVMEEAFRTLVQNLPEDAPAFFREGMEQMDALNYPAAVREVMERYYRQWCAQPTLH